MNNPEAIRYVNEVVRPLAESVRSLKARIDAALVTWNNGVNTTINADGAAAVEDGREAEGVSRLTCADVTNLISQLATIQTQLDGSGVAGVIAKPCVRPLEA